MPGFSTATPKMGFVNYNVISCLLDSLHIKWPCPLGVLEEVIKIIVSIHRDSVVDMLIHNVTLQFIWCIQGSAFIHSQNKRMQQKTCSNMMFTI